MSSPFLNGGKMATFNVSEFDQLISLARAKSESVLQYMSDCGDVCSHQARIFQSEDSSLSASYYEVSNAVYKCGDKFSSVMAELLQAI